MTAGDVASGKNITIRAEPIASGGMTPLPPLMTVHPMVSTRKKVPMNSTTYLFIAGIY